MLKPSWQPVSKPKPRRRPKKRTYIKDEARHDNYIEVKIFGERFSIKKPRIKAKSFHNPPIAQKPRIDLGETSEEKPSEGLVRHTQEVPKSVTEINSKVRKLKTYNKAINNSVHGNK